MHLEAVAAEDMPRGQGLVDMFTQLGNRVEGSGLLVKRCGGVLFKVDKEGDLYVAVKTARMYIRILLTPTTS